LPGTIIAIAALVFAVGGTSYAVTTLPRNSVGTAQLKNRAVSTAKLATAASARIAGLTYARGTFAASPQMGGVIDVPCPSGLTVIAGGVQTPHTLNTFLVDSHPTKSGWEASVENDSDIAQPITVYAICAEVEGGNARSSLAGAATVHRFRLAR
jgi:hypothetical protein